MARRRQKNNLLPKMIGIAVIVNAILLPILAQFGVFKGIHGQRLDIGQTGQSAAARRKSLSRKSRSRKSTSPKPAARGFPDGRPDSASLAPEPQPAQGGRFRKHRQRKRPRDRQFGAAAPGTVPAAPHCSAVRSCARAASVCTPACTGSRPAVRPRCGAASAARAGHRRRGAAGPAAPADPGRLEQ